MRSVLFLVTEVNLTNTKLGSVFYRKPREKQFVPEFKTWHRAGSVLILLLLKEESRLESRISLYYSVPGRQLRM